MFTWLFSLSAVILQIKPLQNLTYQFLKYMLEPQGYSQFYFLARGQSNAT